MVGGASAAVAAVGFVSGVRIAWGIHTGPIGPTKDYDKVWYGVIPAGVYLAVFAAGGALVLRPGEWTLAAVAGLLMAQLLIAMHNAWDLVTFLAPRTDDKAAAKTADEATKKTP
jgi:hypothetical protein